MRVSLFGGGSDIPAHFTEHGGAVLGMAIDKYCYTFFKQLPPFFDHKYRIVYRQIETVQSIDDIAHPLVRTTLQQANLKHGLEIMHNGELPARSGMGSSSAFAVGLSHAIAAQNGHMVTKKMLAETAIHIERDLIPEAGGWQDQIWAAYGGLNRIDFIPGDGFSVSPLILSKAVRNELVSSIVLFDTRLSRDASEIETDKEHRVRQNAQTLIDMAAMTDRAYRILSDGGPSAVMRLGSLLRESWEMKKTLSADVTTSEIDAMYKAGIDAGAWGGKLLGAGSGGFLLFLVPPSARPALRRALSGLIEINVEVDYEGSKVVLYQPDGL
jgi:D-glycero-alpha-D-manno-heptose-7-phosphate kinase